MMMNDESAGNGTMWSWPILSYYSLYLCGAEENYKTHVRIGAGM
jgi:hypothetical protein